MDFEPPALSGDRLTGFERLLVVLVGVAALSAALLAGLQAEAGRQSDRAFLRASRLTLELFERIAGSGPAMGFQLDALGQSDVLSLAGSARLVASAGQPEAAALAHALGSADVEAGERLEEAAVALTREPDPTSGVDPHTVDVLTTTVPELAALVQEQNRQVEIADRYGAREQKAIFALSLDAIAAALLGLAGVMSARRAGLTCLVMAGVMLLGTAVTGLGALLA